MKSHLNSFVAVFVMHVVDDVQCIDIYLCKPFHHVTEFALYFIVIQIFGCDRTVLRSHLILGNFVHTTVDCVKQTFCKVCAGSEELHFLTYAHRGYAACDCVVITMCHSHQVIVLILDGRRLDGCLRTETLEVFRKSCGPQYGQVRFRCCSKVLQCMKVTVGHLCNHRTSVDSHTSDRLCYPCRVSGEQCIVFRCSRKFYKTQLHNEVVDEFLNLLLCECAVCKVTLSIDIEECGSTSKGHCRTVLLLDCSKVSEIQPLNRFLYIFSRSGNVKSVDLSQFF